MTGLEPIDELVSSGDKPKNWESTFKELYTQAGELVWEFSKSAKDRDQTRVDQTQGFMACNKEAIGHALNSHLAPKALEILASLTNPQFFQSSTVLIDMLSVIGNNTEVITQELQKDNAPLAAMVLDRFLRLRARGEEAGTLKDHLAEYSESVAKRHSVDSELEAQDLSLILTYGSTRSKKRVKAILAGELAESTESDQARFAQVLRIGTPGAIEETMLLLQDFLEEKDLKSAELIQNWRDCSPKEPIGGRVDDFPDVIRVNISAINSLESIQPKASRLLYEEYGIRNFGRFPESILIKMHEGIEGPYVINLNYEISFC